MKVMLFYSANRKVNWALICLDLIAFDKLYYIIFIERRTWGNSNSNN